MKEQLYAIPVNDAFNTDCECPLCAMFHKLETDAIEYTMGPSYMEADTREQTDELGFCDKHIRDIYHQDNRLGMAWVMKTHYDNVIKNIQKDTPKGTAKLLKKGIANSKLIQYTDRLEASCFVCKRVNGFISRYIETVFYLYKGDPEFREKFKNCKGFCTSHYSTLLKNCTRFLGGSELEEFVELTNTLYITNMERVRDDLAWFINKFDYKYHDEPWYNAKDSVARSMIKSNGVFIDK